MGMSQSPLSMFRQMGSSIGRFSYCLPHILTPLKTTFLRFGDDVTGRNLSSTPFLNHDYKYKVGLVDISIHSKRLNLPNGTFPRGCMLDAGCSHNLVEMRVYEKILTVLMQYFERFNMSRIRASVDGFLGEELCYRPPRGFKSYQSMTYHFPRGGL
ncbi:Unknown protein [Striga hermonthica]|uniref:Xylanase inhibitor C-terminal domain-containing protein n=1 Tax=Striga hermonthica TaxID=68872 RepID=A0A9N7MK12_STRHE|nr:Unknown protein [Striga hermonthica]